MTQTAILFMAHLSKTMKCYTTHTDREAVSRPYTYATRYYYDESGNRVRKLEYFNTQTNPPLITDWNNPGNGWTLSNNEFYVKGSDGKDLATYQGSELEDWYVWGNDLAGKIRKDKPYYYFKDHLGSVRAIVNENAQIVAAYDGACPPWRDAWGYPLEGRSYYADSMKFKYTGKELDKESLYDYFRARYYDSRIGRWGQVEPLLDKYPSLTPYNYSVDNPLRVIDPNGADPFEIIVRTYIPFDIVFPGFLGDSRGADPNASSFRTEQRITVETDRSVSSTIITSYDAKISPSTLIVPSSPMPSILSGMGEGKFHALAGYSSELNGGNNASVELTGEAHVGVIPTALSPAIDYTFGITILPQKDGSVQVQLTGSHDKFPAYEIYIKDKSGNTTPIYNQSPVDPIGEPFYLFPNPFGNQNVNSEHIIP